MDAGVKRARYFGLMAIAHAFETASFSTKSRLSPVVPVNSNSECQTTRGDISVFNPVYLAQSRNGVFYFRWPLPKQLHPLGKPSTLKLSLRTREPQKALRLSRSLTQIGERLNEYGLNSGMRYDELRARLTDHFRVVLDQVKEE